MTDIKSVTEDELKARSVAPRVTLAELEANIKHVIYMQHKLLTICILELQNGFMVTGESACADAANFNEEIGQRLATTNAKNKIWPLMGYALKSKLTGSV